MLEEARQVVEDGEDDDADDVQPVSTDLRRRHFHGLRADGPVASDAHENRQPHGRRVRHQRERPHVDPRRFPLVVERVRVLEDGRETVDDERTQQEQRVGHGEALEQEHRARLGVVSTQHEQRRDVAGESDEAQRADDDREDDEVEQTAAVVRRGHPVVFCRQHR